MFIKIYPYEINEEILKNQKIFEISLKNNFFFPRLISYSLKESRINFSLIKNTFSLRELFFENNNKLNKEKIAQHFFKSGQALACIHRDLKYENTINWNFNNIFSKINKNIFNIKVPKAILHGDYTASNILVKKDEKIVVIDASPNFHNTFSSFEYGPIYVDIGNFLSGIRGLFSYKKFFLINKEYIDLCQNSFINGYESEGFKKLDPNLVETYTMHCAKNYLKIKNNFFIFFIKYVFYCFKNLKLMK